MLKSQFDSWSKNHNKEHKTAENASLRNKIH